MTSQSSKNQRRIIWDDKSQEILAIGNSPDQAHSIAETLSYIKHTNATYGLFGMALKSHNEICQTPQGKQAWTKFLESI